MPFGPSQESETEWRGKIWSHDLDGTPACQLEDPDTPDTIELAAQFGVLADRSI
jgi:hypothetical protein